MAIPEIINPGTPNNKDGDKLRNAFVKVINIFNDIYSKLFTKTSELINDGEDGVNPFINLTHINIQNVTNAGALMDSEIENLDQVKAFDSDDYATAAQGDLVDNSVQVTGDQLIEGLKEFKAEVSRFYNTNQSIAIEIRNSLLSIPTSSIPSIIGTTDTFDGNTNGDLIFQARTGIGKIQFFSDGIRKMVMLNSGNFGIGTSSPTEKLQVSGNVKATKFIGDGSELTGLRKPFEPYDNETLLFNDQAEQEEGYAYFVTNLDNIYLYLGTTNGDEDDYKIYSGDNYATAAQGLLANTSMQLISTIDGDFNNHVETGFYKVQSATFSNFPANSNIGNGGSLIVHKVIAGTSNVSTQTIIDLNGKLFTRAVVVDFMFGNSETDWIEYANKEEVDNSVKKTGETNQSIEGDLEVEKSISVGDGSYAFSKSASPSIADSVFTIAGQPTVRQFVQYLDTTNTLLWGVRFHEGGSNYRNVISIKTNDDTVDTLRNLRVGEKLLVNTSTAHSSAQVQIDSTTTGSLAVPRMTKVQRVAISTPATGLQVYQTDERIGLFTYNGTDWVNYIRPPFEPYDNETLLFNDQSEQEESYAYYVTGLDSIYLYLGTTNGDVTDYQVFIANNTFKATFTIDLIDLQEVDFYASRDLKINTITNLVASPTITLKVNDSTYTLEDLISQGDKVTVESDIASVINLNAIYE